MSNIIPINVALRKGTNINPAVNPKLNLHNLLYELSCDKYHEFGSVSSCWIFTFTLKTTLGLLKPII